MNEDIQNPFSFIADFEGDISQVSETEVPTEIAILPMRGLILFPCVMTPIRVTRPSSMKLVKQAFETGQLIGAFCQLNADEEDLN